MMRKGIVVVALLAAGLLIGCGDKASESTPETTPMKTATGSQPEMPMPAATHAGKVLMETSCTTCHGKDKVTSAKMSREDWESQVEMCMSMDGAPEPLSEGDNAKLVDYLATNYGE